IALRNGNRKGKGSGFGVQCSGNTRSSPNNPQRCEPAFRTKHSPFPTLNPEPRTLNPQDRKNVGQVGLQTLMNFRPWVDNLNVLISRRSKLSVMRPTHRLVLTVVCVSSDA